MNQQETNLSDIDIPSIQEGEARDYSPMPEAQYTGVVIQSARTDSSTGGQILRFTLQITEGEYQGRRVFSTLNIVNNSPDAQRIGREQLKALCAACGQASPKSTFELHNIPINFVTKNEAYQGKVTAKTEVFKPMARLGAATPNHVPASQPSPPPQQYQQPPQQPSEPPKPNPWQ